MSGPIRCVVNLRAINCPARHPGTVLRVMGKGRRGAGLTLLTGSASVPGRGERLSVSVDMVSGQPVGVS